MAVASDQARDDLIGHLRTYLHGKLSDAEAALLVQFSERYYASAAIEDLLAHTQRDLFGALLNHWYLMYQRKPSEVKILIKNPTLAEDGWESKHTIIQVSHDDIPFLVDSIRMELNRNHLEVHFANHFGGLKVIRDEQGRITEILPPGRANPQASSEAPMYFEIDRINDPTVIENLRNSIERILGDVRVCVADWHKMVEHVEESLHELEKNPPSIDAAEITESKYFLRWLVNNNFTFLGCRDYKLVGDDADRALVTVPNTGLGVLRDDGTCVVSKQYSDLPPEARKQALSQHILIIAKTNTKASVHRDVYTDYISVKRFNENGEVIGERRFVGLYTTVAYHASPRHIPFLRHKVAKVLHELGFPLDSHNGKAAVNILETLPRDDLFQASHEELLILTLNILQLQERKRVRLFVRKETFGRYYSCLVFVPRDIFTTDLCLTLQDILMHCFEGIESSYATYLSESVLARIHYIIRVNPKNAIQYNIKEIEQKLISASRTWVDEFRDRVITEFGEAEGLRYFNKYRKSLPASYTEYYLPATAIDDISKIESLTAQNPLGMIFYRSGQGQFRLKLFHIEHTLALSDVLPTLENMGLRVIGERPHEIVFKDGNTVWICDFDMIHVRNQEIDLEAGKDIFQDAFANIWQRNAEDDRFNRLVLDAQLGWREIAALRAYTKYLRQTGFTFSQNYIEQALINNATIAKDLVNLFVLRFSPEYRADTSEVLVRIEQALDAVTSLDEDRILRKLLELILATVRTNYFQKGHNNTPKNYISFKFNPALITDLPLPRPMYEIFVYSPKVEGVHLRAGKVARGGIRWSDRREDFRTEVLGLMKAQNVKNSVIVPVGAKGGFVAKQLPVDGDRDMVLQEVIVCYSTFIRGMLDITDNIQNQVIIKPIDVVCYDEDDPYLVVAADKGTATFSDIANRIAEEYSFWLGDAFASGGSQGYDHKKMGITARGAWESVKRHFCELGLNPQTMDFTVVGIGDMSGDVFGNGMLMSQHIKLLGAFDHRHIFIDPNPDPAVSYIERKRLFNLPRSSWMDYNPTLISSGGGVFNRSAKSIKLSPEIRAMLGVDKESMIPNDLVRALLKAQVDLIMNGGIGTFVKASTESHLDVGDRTNDGIRIDGKELRARVVCEGGNLGCTQLGRIEYSLNGGIIYTDFIDNSAGVDCSDHEVNIKILLNKLVREGRMDSVTRNKLLENMTDEVCALVLKDNYEQTQIVSLEASVATLTLDLFRRYINTLEKEGNINRQLEFLPEEKAILERKAEQRGLTRPEIAVLVAYSKIFLKQDILATDVPEDPFFSKYLLYAFPETLHKDYLADIQQHSLRREIIATQLARSITDHMGINFVDRLQYETGAPTNLIIRAYVVVEQLFGMIPLWHAVEALDWQVPAATQHHMMLEIYYLIRRATRWFLRNRKTNAKIEEALNQFAQPLADLIKQLPELLTEQELLQLQNNTAFYIDKGVPEATAKQVAECKTLFTALEIVDASTKYNLNIVDMAKTYYSLNSFLELDWLRDQMQNFPIDDQWDELARSGLRDELDRAQKKLSVSILKGKAKSSVNKTIEQRVQAWAQQNKVRVERWQTLLTEVKSSSNVDFVSYSVILRELFDFAKV